MRTCSKCRRDNADEARFCQFCGTPVQTDAVEEQRKIVTVVFTDVTGSTALGERLDPETVRGLMGRYFDAVRAAIEHHGGTVEKFIGDAVMAVFGVPVLHEDDALRAVRAAVEMREALAALNEQLQAERGVSILTRTGVNTGQVVASDVAARERFVTGDTVNVAARLEQAAAPGEILLGVSTKALTRDAVQVESVEPLRLKGKSEPVPAFRLLSLRGATAGRERRLDSPMIGRERQLRTLGEAFEAAVTDRACQLVTVLGSPGVGKTRLVQEFVSGVEGAGVHRGHCLSYGDAITFWPIKELVRSMVGATQAAAAQEVLAALRQSLEGADDAEAVAVRLAGLIGLSPEPSTQQDGFWAVRRLVEHRAAAAPLILVVDDIHWAEPTLLDLIEYIVDWARETPVLVLSTARPELLDDRPDWGGGKAHATSILLEPLSAADSELLVDSLLGGVLPDSARERIASAAEGNPFFVEEMLAMLVDDGLLRKEDDLWVVTADVSDVGVPATVQTLIAARLDRLGRDERTVISRGSVEGTLFHVRSVAALAPEVGESIRKALRALVRKEMIRPDRAEFVGDDAYRFRHQLIRDASYESLSKQTRAELHERFARWLADRTGETAGLDTIIAHHFERAHVYRVELGSAGTEVDELADQATIRYERAARVALAHGDPRGGVQLLRRAIGLDGAAQSERALETRLLLGSGLVETGGFVEAGELFADVETRARALGATRIELHAGIGRLRVRDRLDTESSNAALTIESERLQAGLLTLGDLAGAATAIIPRIFWLRYDIAPKVADEAAALAHEAGDPALETEALGWKVVVGFWGSMPAGQGAQATEQLLSREGLDRDRQSSALGLLGGYLGMLGRFEEGREAIARGRTIANELGLSTAGYAFWGGFLEVFAGELGRSEDVIRDGFEKLASLGEKNRLSTLAAMLAELLAIRGDVAEAERYLEISLEASSPDDVDSHSSVAGARAILAIREGDTEKATALASSAAEMMRGRGAAWREGLYLMVLADAREAAGDLDGATDALALALERFEKKELLPLEARTRGRLLALRSG
jgi:class 3 adenylate cyclase